MNLFNLKLRIVFFQQIRRNQNYLVGKRRNQDVIEPISQIDSRVFAIIVQPLGNPEKCQVIRKMENNTKNSPYYQI